MEVDLNPERMDALIFYLERSQIADPGLSDNDRKEMNHLGDLNEIIYELFKASEIEKRRREEETAEWRKKEIAIHDARMLKEACSRPGIRELVQVRQSWNQSLGKEEHNEK